MGDVHEMYSEYKADRQNPFNDPPHDIFDTGGHVNNRPSEDFPTRPPDRLGDQLEDDIQMHVGHGMPHSVNSDGGSDGDLSRDINGRMPKSVDFIGNWELRLPIASFYSVHKGSSISTCKNGSNV